jgi:putative proteasome-type protease
MTYCVGLCLSGGLVLLSDTLTNAGLDNISRFTKMFTFERPGERVMALMTSGNLSITQGVIARLRYRIRCGVEDPGLETIMNAESMFQVAQKVGEEMVQMQAEHRDAILRHGTSPDACILLAGQRKGGKHRLFQIYSAGNFIKATPDTPFFQLGEHKYGKPILDRIITPQTSLEEGIKAVCVSMDSTQKSNLSVGMPLDLAVIEQGALGFRLRRRIERDDPGYSRISQAWAVAIRRGFEDLPAFPE